MATAVIDKRAMKGSKVIVWNFSHLGLEQANRFGWYPELSINDAKACDSFKRNGRESVWFPIKHEVTHRNLKTSFYISQYSSRDNNILQCCPGTQVPTFTNSQGNVPA